MNEEDITMENNYDNIPGENNASKQENVSPDVEQQKVEPSRQYTDPNAGTQYSDPNAGQQPYNSQTYQYAGQNDNGQQYQYTGQNNYQQDGYGQQSGYNYQQNNYNTQGYNYQDNYNYNTGSYNQVNNQGMDMRPLTMGEWVLTILAPMIPCVGIIFYFVWAFSKTGNINRRNYCRASLIITGVCLLIYIVFIAIFGVALFGSYGVY